MPSIELATTVICGAGKIRMRVYPIFCDRPVPGAAYVVTYGPTHIPVAFGMTDGDGYLEFRKKCGVGQYTVLVTSPLDCYRESTGVISVTTNVCGDQDLGRFNLQLYIHDDFGVHAYNPGILGHIDVSGVRDHVFLERRRHEANEIVDVSGCPGVPCQSAKGLVWGYEVIHGNALTSWRYTLFCDVDLGTGRRCLYLGVSYCYYPVQSVLPWIDGGARFGCCLWTDPETGTVGCVGPDCPCNKPVVATVHLAPMPSGPGCWAPDALVADLTNYFLYCPASPYGAPSAYVGGGIATACLGDDCCFGSINETFELQPPPGKIWLYESPNGTASANDPRRLNTNLVGPWQPPPPGGTTITVTS
jgi:hypothetical protein